MFLSLYSKLPQRKRGNTCAFMCKERQSATINVSFCTIEDCESVQECDIWLCRLKPIVIKLVHSHSSVCTYTHPRWQSESLCVCVVTTHLFHIEALLHQRMLVESPFTSGTILEILFFCWRFVWELFSPSLMTMPSCWWFIRRKFRTVCGTNKFFGGGLELSNHTLHSLARNVITYKENAASLTMDILNLNL